MKKILLLLATLLLLACGAAPTEAPQGRSTQASLLDDEENCGATGYACTNGRECLAGLCSPAWQPISTSGAPVPRAYGSAGFLDGKYVVVGGCEHNYSEIPEPALESGGAYDPATDTWSGVEPLAEGRFGSAQVTAPGAFIVHGGLSTCWDGTTIGPGLEALFDVGSEWAPIEATGAVPAVRYAHEMAWTDDGLFVFGGADNENSTLATGASLVFAETWLDAFCELENCARASHYTVFKDGGIVRIMGGDVGEPGVAFDMSLRTWATWEPPLGGPDYASEVGDAAAQADDGRRIYRMGSGGVWIYDRTLGSWTLDPASPPSGLCWHAMVAWSGSELVAWSGCGEGSSAGGRYQPPAPGVTP